MIGVVLLGMVVGCGSDESGGGGAATARVRVAGPDGLRLVHASGFSFDPGTRIPEEAAASFLRAQGSAFGVTPRQTLTVKHGPAPGRAGAVRFERSVDGLPVFGGDLVVGVDATGAVFVVNGADVPPATAGAHRLGAAAAGTAARNALGQPPGAAGPSSVTAGWRAVRGSLRAVYRVDFIAAEPPGDWRAFVDGETGEVLFREDLRRYASAPGKAFEVSPAETAAAACPFENDTRSLCASPVAVTMPDLTSDAELSGTQASVFQCGGANAPVDARAFPGACTSVPSTAGAFEFVADSTFRSPTDAFAAAMAYYQLDKHVTFLKSLDPTLPPGPGRAVRASLPALVNAFESGGPLENAYYSPMLDAMVFGQGKTTDYAYDATVAYHELSHAAIGAWGDFSITQDALGGLDEPDALGEGTADALAVSALGRSGVGAFVAASTGGTTPFLRDVSDPDAARTCRGSGTVISRFGAQTIDGLDGEVHDDGEIWSGLLWEVDQGLKDAGVRGCNGACDAGAAIQYLAVQLAGGTSPTFETYWQTLRSAAAALFPSRPDVASYVECVARRRHLDACDRTVPVYAGETKLQYVRLRYSPFQITLQDEAPGTVTVCSFRGTSTKLHARKGEPVKLSSEGVVADVTLEFAQRCGDGTFPIDLEPGDAGTWYLLFDSPTALVPGADVYQVVAGTTGIAARPAASLAPACQLPTATAGAPTPTPTPSPSPSPGPGPGPGSGSGSGGSGGGCGTGDADMPGLALAAATLLDLLRRRAGREGGAGH